MRKSIVFLTAIIALMFIFFINQMLYKNTELNSSEINYLKSKKEIVFISQNNYQPFEFLSNNLQSSGMMIDLIRWISTEFGFEPVFKNTTFANAQDMVLKGEADVLTSFFYSTERDKIFDFTKPVFKIPASIFVRPNNTSIKSIDDLNNKKVAIQKGDYAISYIKSKNINIDLVTTEDFHAATNRLIKGDVDAVIGDEQIIFFYLNKFDLTSEVKTVGQPLYTGLNCMATKEGNKILISILNKGILKAQKAGVLDSINKKWFGIYPDNTYKKALSFFIVFLIILFILLIILWFWNIILNKKVKEKTTHLTEINQSLQQSNNKLNAIFQASPDGIGICSLEGELLFISDNFAKMYHIPVEEKEFYLGKSVFSFLDPLYVNSAKEHFQQLLKGEKKEKLSEYLAINKQNQRFWIEVSSSVIYGKNNKPENIIFIVRDITERKKLEQELMEYYTRIEQNKAQAEELKEKAEKANKAKSDFLAIISHELRTPLNALLGYLELLSFNPNKLNEYLPIMISSGELLKTLINDISDLNKIEQGRFELIEKRFNLSELQKDIIYNSKLSNESKNYDISFDIDPMDINVVGDNLRLKQVMLNIINNAKKYTTNGSIKVCFKKLYEDHGKIRFLFSVEDTGIGIKEENLQRIFLPFQRINDDKNQKKHGSGIGLYISKTIIEMMGSTIEVKSEYGKGSTFYFELELHKATPEMFINEETNYDFSKLKALIVEDNTVNALIAQEMLRKLNIQSSIATNGKQAIEMLKQESFDFVLMDIQMPEMDGLETTRKIREMGLDTKIYAMSANVYQKDFDEALASGMNDFCPKPISLEMLKKLLIKHFPVIT
ncbi:MAG: transporter substrate-binding domain-containing protein [Calditerrivibrio sp.]|nr:transporter substrate-binding domain-containing protein [Calditerrivibrio sp.]